MELKASLTKRPSCATKAKWPWGSVWRRPDKSHLYIVVGWWLFEFYVGVWREK